MIFFAYGVSPKQIYEVVTKDDLLYLKEQESFTYGSYATCGIVSKRNNKFYNNVTISPLAWYYIKEDNLDKVYLLFAIFEDAYHNKTKAVVYVTDFTAEYIIRKAPHLLRENIYSPFRCDDTWESLMTDKEHVKWKNDYEYKLFLEQMNAKYSNKP